MNVRTNDHELSRPGYDTRMFGVITHSLSTDGCGMPRICEFYGIAIYMYYRDHAPPHFHAIYGDNEAVITIRSAEMIKGRIPERAWGLVREWSMLHEAELEENWELARLGKPLKRIRSLV